MVTRVTAVIRKNNGSWLKEKGGVSLVIEDGQIATRDDIQRKLLPGGLIPFGLNSIEDRGAGISTMVRVRPGTLLKISSKDVEVLASEGKNAEVKKSVVLPSGLTEVAGSRGLRITKE